MKTEIAIAHFLPPDQKRGRAIRRLADTLGISRHAVYQWGEDVPRLRALELERTTRGRLKADDENRKAA